MWQILRLKNLSKFFRTTDPRDGTIKSFRDRNYKTLCCHNWGGLQRVPMLWTMVNCDCISFLRLTTWAWLRYLIWSTYLVNFQVQLQTIKMAMIVLRLVWSRLLLWRSEFKLWESFMLKILDVSIEFSLTNSHHLDADYLTYIKALKYWAAIEGNISYGQKRFMSSVPRLRSSRSTRRPRRGPRSSTGTYFIYCINHLRKDQSLKKGSRT